MANHYHIVSKLDNREYGGSIEDRGFGAGLPMSIARDDARAMAGERGFNKLAGGLWSDAKTCDEFNSEPYSNRQFLQHQYIMIDPCDNEVDFGIPWDAYRGDDGELHRAPTGKPCSSAIKAEAWLFFV